MAERRIERLVLVSSGPGEDRPWIRYIDRLAEVTRDVDSSYRADRIPPQAGSLIVIVEAGTPGAPVFLRVEDKASRSLLCAKECVMRRRPFSGMRTRELLALLEMAHKTADRYGSVGDAKRLSEMGFSADQVKTELAKREHVPSKPEAKALRREAAQRKN